MNRTHFWLPKIFIHVAMPTFLGSLIYILWRSRTLTFFRWFELLGADELIRTLRSAAIPFRTLTPDWVVYNLPAGLWLYSMVAVFRFIWRDVNSWHRYLWNIGTLFLGLGCELAQAAAILPGTFDLDDAVFYFSAWCAANMTQLLQLTNLEKLK